MGPNIMSLFIVLLFTTISCTSAYNITYLLSNHPELSTFNYLLTKTGMDKTINNMKSTITVLAVDDSAMGSLSGQSLSSQQTMLETHVLFDDFDTNKLTEMKTNRTVTNLYHKSGNTTGLQGIVNIAKNGDDVIFYSAVDGAPKSSKLVKQVGSKPFDIIVLQINTPIVVPGLNGTPIVAPPTKSRSLREASSQNSSTPAPAPAPAPKSRSTPSPSPQSRNTSSPSPQSRSVPAPAPQSSRVSAPGPAAPPFEIISAPAPAPGPDAEAPAADDELADGPEANSSPAPSPNLSPEEAPVDDDMPDKSSNKNGGGRIMANAGGLVVGLILALAL